MAWIESHDDVWDHWKTDKLINIIANEFEGIQREELRVMVVGMLHSLWHFVLKQAWRDADLERWGIHGIERAARWYRKPGVFVAALRESGYMDDYIIHGWQERAGRLVYERFRNESRRSTAALPPQVCVKSKATVPNPTVPNPTVPKTMDIGRIIPPKLEWVASFCKERNNGVDPDKFFAHYESNGWRVGRNAMKNWKAAICGTWEKNNGHGNGNKRIVGGARPVPGKYDHLG